MGGSGTYRCYWPPFTSEKTFQRAMADLDDRQDDWKTVPIKLVKRCRK